MTRAADPYAHSAPFIDPLIAGFWEATGPTLARELTTVAARSGPVVDVGAGSGRGVRTLRGALPEAPVVAVEPSPALRTALIARLVDDPALGEHVTVVADDALGFAYPDGLRAVIAMNMIGHLTPDDRRALWSRIAGRLAPGGALFVNNVPPTTPSAVPPSEGASFRLGDHEYRGRSEAEPAGEDSVMWHMRYETLRDGAVVSAVEVDYHWYVVSETELREEWAARGLTAHRVGEEPTPLYRVTAAG